MIKFTKKIITKNLWAKLLCLLAAFLLWLWVASSQNTIAKFPGTLTIKASNTPANLVPIFDTDEVSVKILAEPSVWQQLSVETFTAEINLTGLTAGTHQVPVNVTSSISGVQIVDQNPSSILVTLEPLAIKTVKVSERIDGSAADGMVPGDIAFSPDTVQIKGAKSVVADINEVVATVTLSGQDADFTANINPHVLDEKGQQINDITVSPDSVQAQVSVVKGSNTKTVGVKVQVNGVPADNYYISNITSTPGAIDISGVRSTVLATSYLSTQPIDVTGATSDITKDISLSVPSGLTILNNNSTKIHVTISISPTETSKTFNLTNFKVSSGNYKIVSTDPGSISVVCAGSLDQLNSLGDKDFTVLLDLTTNQPDSSGISNLVLSKTNIQVPAGITVVSISTPALKVRVQ